MREVIFTHIHAENFCNISKLDADFSNKTVVKGFNREGKTTIRNMILWVMTDKLSDNSSAGDSIRRHDENGKRIDDVVIRVDLTVSIDGLEFIFTKIQKQKWVKKRGTETAEFQGNENLYEISGVPKKSKDFEQFISENICPVEELPFCINANAFLSMDNKKRRAKLLGMAKKFTNDDVVATDDRFKELANDLKVGSEAELVKRAKQALSTLKKTLEELPARIDEANKQMVDYDFSALELEKNALNEEYASLEATEKADFENRDKALKARFELSEIANKLNASVKDKQHAIEMQVAELKMKLRGVADDISMLMTDKEKAEQMIANNDKAIEEAEKQKSIAIVRVFDDSSLVCPTCGQNYPADKEQEIRERFEKNRQDEMSRLVDYIESLKYGKETATARIGEIENKISEKKVEKSSIEKAITKKENEAAGIVLADATKDAEYRAKMDEITALESSITNSAFVVEKGEIRGKIREVEHKLAQKDANARIEERIEILKGEKKELGQKILEQERLLSLLEDFSRAKIALLENSVNEYFTTIKWKFWENLINGGYQEVCKAMVCGESYDSLLNKSDRLLCQADIVNGFQKANDVSLPVMIDDCESIDSDRIPVFDKQTIMFRRDDCKLAIERLE